MQIYCKFCGATNLSTSGGGILCRRCGHLLEMEDQKEDYHLQNGTILHQVYRVVALLGEGGFGITYKAYDEQTARLVAIKELYSKDIVRRNVRYSVDVALAYDIHTDDYEKTKKRFIEEAKALMQFRGEQGIVQILDFFEENNTAYLVTEYLEGRTLKEYLKQSGALPWEKAYRLLCPVMESLGRIHEKGVIHRDISSANMMMVKEEKLVLLDFGAFKTIPQDTFTNTSIFAKRGYTPIEQYSGNDEIGTWTDVYALTAVFYECVTGEMPPDSLQRVVYDEYQTMRAKGYPVPQGIEEICSKGLAIHVADRFRDMPDLMMAFEARIRVKPKKKSLFLWIGLILVLLLIGILAVVF
ncbi:MAG: serine/threonine protein kinase [Lachnospiraceae bacterium]|nr:serine/threonine protein kinase [Lachnospiraceae bacterium]